MPTYSNSRLSTFEQCPLKFKFHYIDKIETEQENSIEAFMGSMVHESLEKLYKDIRFAKRNELKEILEYYEELWNKNWTEGILIVRKEYTAENFRKMGEKFITEYYSRYYPFEHGRTIGLEMQIMIKIDNYVLQGFVDRLTAMPDGIYEIHDYKTSNSLPTQENVDNDRQLALYAIAVKQMYRDCKEVILVWHYLAFDKELRSTRTEIELAALKREVAELITKIETTKQFPAVESALCDWCEFQSICPQWKHKFELETKEENEYRNDSGLKLVNEYAKLKHEEDAITAKLEKVRIALMDFSERERVSNVFGSEHVVVIRKYPRLSFPKKDDIERKEFDDALKKLGLWNELATVDVYELAKKINNDELHPDFLKLIQRFIQKSENVVVKLKEKRVS